MLVSLSVLLLLLLLLGVNTVTSQCGPGVIEVRILFGVELEHEDIVNAENNNPLSLTCSATDQSGGGFDRYQWRRNGVIVQDGTESILSIETLSSGDGGEYTCTAVPRSMNCTEMSPVTIVTTEPSITDVEPESGPLTLIEGEPLTLRCFAEGWPTPTLQWSSIPDLGRVVPPGAVYSDPAVSTNESAAYTCTANNTRGFISIIVTVNVLVSTTSPPTSPPASSQGSSPSMPEDRPTEFEPAIPFIVSIVVISAFGLLVSLLTIIAIGTWLCVSRSSQPRQGVVMEELENGRKKAPPTGQISEQEGVMPTPNKKRNRA